jgi:hypothetical protein
MDGILEPEQDPLLDARLTAYQNRTVVVKVEPKDPAEPVGPEVEPDDSRIQVVDDEDDGFMHTNQLPPYAYAGGELNLYFPNHHFPKL